MQTPKPSHSSLCEQGRAQWLPFVVAILALLIGTSVSSLAGELWLGPDPGASGRRRENEFDVDVQWRPKWSFLNGFSARLRYALVQQYQGAKNNIHEYRLIMNYQLPLF